MSEKDKPLIEAGEPSEATAKDSVPAEASSKPSTMKSSGTQAKQPKKAKKAKSSSAKWLFLLILLAALAYASFWLWQQWQEYQGSLKQADSSQHFSQSLASQQQSITALSGEQTKLAQQSQQNIDALKLQIEALQSELSATQRKFQVINSDQQQEWQLAEIEFLIKQAAQKLYFSDDQQSIIALLNAADQQVISLADNSLLPLRQAIALDRQNINSFGRIDYDGIMLKLNALKQAVPQLELASVQFATTADKETATTELNQTEQSTWQKFTAKIDQSLSKYYKVHHYKEAVKPFISANQDQQLRQNMLLNLQIAQLSALRKDTINYQAALSELTEWSRQYFKQDSSSAKAFAQQLNQLAQQKFTLLKPESLSSLKIIQQLISQRTTNWLKQPSPINQPVVEQSPQIKPETPEKKNLENTSEADAENSWENNNQEATEKEQTGDDQ